MSWGGGEFSGEATYDSQYFSNPGVAFVVASGDSGAPAEWPAASPDVLGVGGTSLTLTAAAVGAARPAGAAAPAAPAPTSRSRRTRRAS